LLQEQKRKITVMVKT